MPKYGPEVQNFLWYLNFFFDIWTFFLTIIRRDLNWQKKVQISPKKNRYHSIYPDFFSGKIPIDNPPWKSKKRWNWVSEISFFDKIVKIEIQARCSRVFLSELNENIETHFCVLRSRSTMHILKKLEFKISRNLIKKIKSGVYHAELCQTDLEEVRIHSIYVI